MKKLGNGKFEVLAEKLTHNRWAAPHMITFDPGGTTGVSHWRGTSLVAVEQVAGTPLHVARVIRDRVAAGETPDLVFLETFRLYPWKVEELIWDDLLTVRLIGVLELVCADNRILMIKAGAGQAKGFCTDNKLEAWEYRIPGQKHAMDAVRHGCYAVLKGIKSAYEEKATTIPWL